MKILIDSTMLMLLSPVHPSISKMNYVSKLIYRRIKRNNFKTKVIVLGGILAENIKFTLTNGFDDVAL
jgi:thiamine-phosphate pyrophosphorylase